MAQLNILDVNVCTFRECNCGWNLHVGGRDHRLLGQLLGFLNQYTFEDRTDYTEKLLTPRYEELLARKNELGINVENVTQGA